MIHLVCFSDSRMTISQTGLVNSARAYGISCHIWRDTDMPEEYYKLYEHMEDSEKEKGFYCYSWKPFIVKETFKTLKEGDILIYADSGQQFVNNPQAVIDEMDTDVFLFSNGWKNEDWTKMDVMNMINGGPTGDKQQVQASLMFFRVSPVSRDFIEEWAFHARKLWVIDNSQSKAANVPTFAETRWDQSIAGTIAIRDNIKLNWFPSTMYMNKQNEYSNRYPAIVDHHRRRNSEYD